MQTNVTIYLNDDKGEVLYSEALPETNVNVWVEELLAEHPTATSMLLRSPRTTASRRIRRNGFDGAAVERIMHGRRGNLDGYSLDLLKNV